MGVKRFLLGVVVLAAAAAGGFYYWHLNRRPDELRLTGVVETREVRLGSKVGGRVAAVHVRESQVVRAGQLLAELEAPELLAQGEQTRAKLAAAQVARDKAYNGPRPREKEAAKAAWEAAEARLLKLERGEREEDRRSAQADIDVARAELALAREEYARTERARSQGAATRSEVDVAAAEVDRTKARLAAAVARKERLETSREEDIAAAKAEVKRLLAEYELLKEGTRYEDREAADAQVNELAGRLKELQANLAETKIYAPGDPKKEPEWRAVVEYLSVRRGDLVGPGTPVVRILQTDDTWVRVYVPETELGRVRLGQPVEVTVDSYPGRRFQGEVIHINSEAEFTPRNVQSVDERHHQVFGIKVRVADPDGVFKSGMAAEVFVPLAD